VPQYLPALTPYCRHSALARTESAPPAAGTFVHETGHWMGLDHTHRGGCLDQDGVSDTPANLNGVNQPWYMKLTALCMAAKKAKTSLTAAQMAKFNSCPAKGVDNVLNYLSYNPAACRVLFTKGQVGAEWGVRGEGGQRSSMLRHMGALPTPVTCASAMISVSQARGAKGMKVRGAGCSSFPLTPVWCGSPSLHCGQILAWGTCGVIQLGSCSGFFIICVQFKALLPLLPL
jgi:hypothetical protein